MHLREIDETVDNIRLGKAFEAGREGLTLADVREALKRMGRGRCMPVLFGGTKAGS